MLHFDELLCRLKIIRLVKKVILHRHHCLNLQDVQSYETLFQKVNFFPDLPRQLART